MKTAFAAIGFILILLAQPIFVAATENKGAERIVIKTAKKESIRFPHRKHQKSLGDCMTCHLLFPKEAGTIEKMIAAGTLKKRQIMNNLCRDCHRKRKKDNLVSGPANRCSGCHGHGGE